MPCLKTIVKLLGFLTGCVRGGNTFQPGEHEQVRHILAMRPPSLRAPKRAPNPELLHAFLRVTQHARVRPARCTACSTPSGACVRPARRTRPASRTHWSKPSKRMRPATAKRTAALNTSIPRTPWWLPQNGGIAFNETPYPRAVLGKKKALVVLLSPGDAPTALKSWDYGVIASDHGGSPIKWVDKVVRSSTLLAQHARNLI